MPVEFKGNYLRVRVFDPGLCKPGTFRTKDPGRKGHTQFIVCERKDTGKWDTQSIRIHKSDLIINSEGVIVEAKNYHTKDMIDKIEDELGYKIYG